jgi:prepilin-type N-terminal cleavage/methylation domain-containing protein
MKTQKGFTLTELLVTLTLTGLFLTVATGLFITSNKSRASQDLTIELQQNARSVVELALREMRSIQTISCMQNTNTPCSGNDKIAFTSVMDLDTRIFSWDANPASPIYFTLQYSKAPAGSPNRQDLAKSITEFSLTPYDGNNNSTNILSQVKRIDVRLNARSSTIDPLTKAYKYYPITETVRIRNVPYP